MLECEVRRAGNETLQYRESVLEGIEFKEVCVFKDDFKKILNVEIRNITGNDFVGVVHIIVTKNCDHPKFFMPGYMYNRNTSNLPSSGRKSFPRLSVGGESMPESEFFMTRSDRLAEPVSLIFDENHVLGISADPVIYDENKEFSQYAGFSCNINDNGKSCVGYTIGYENAPWLFVQSATVLERKPVTRANSVTIESGKCISFKITVYDYDGEDERSVYRAIEDTYWRYHECPRKIDGMNEEKALELLSGAIRDYAWIPEDNQYTGFVYDCPEGFSYNKIPSVSWTNGLVVAVPMLVTANRLHDYKAREQSLTFINDVVDNWLNPSSGFLYESIENGRHTVRGWWYNGMHSGGHSGYLNGQAVYYLLKAYRNELQIKDEKHSKWMELSAKVVSKMNEVMNTDFEYPFAMHEKTGAGIEYDSLGSAWCLAATAMYEHISGDRKYLENIERSEKHYYDTFVRRVECYGGPLDTDKAVDNEGILSYIRAVRILHEITQKDELLDHLRDALYYEFTFKLGYNTVIQIRPLSSIGWSGCGGSITSTANPHIHPMSSTIVDEMRYYLSYRDDKYVRSRMEDTIGWGLQTFNTYDGEYGYGKIGWMSERFCFCEGLLTEKYPDGELASTWFALMPWASSSIIEGFL